MQEAQWNHETSNEAFPQPIVMPEDLSVGTDTTALLRKMALEKQQMQMQEDFRLWKEDKKAVLSKKMFILWIVTVFVILGEYSLILILLDRFPDPEDFGRLDIILTPCTMWFMAGFLGYLVKKIRKDRIWTRKSTIAAAIGMVLGLTVNYFQTILMYLYTILIILPVSLFINSLQSL